MWVKKGRWSPEEWGSIQWGAIAIMVDNDIYHFKEYLKRYPDMIALQKLIDPAKKLGANNILRFLNKN
jgi:uncharacterized protein YbjQ (UPF0145 family)